MNDTDARLWHPWLRINRVLRVMMRGAETRRRGHQLTHQIVEGGCTKPSFPDGIGPKRSLTKQDVELLASRFRRAVYLMGGPWRTLRWMLRKVRPGA